MDRREDERNKEKLIALYDSIPEDDRQSFMEAVEYLQTCFLEGSKKSSKP